MKIITWNCNMAFRKKADHILKYKPDILIVPECEHPDKLKFSEGSNLPAAIIWSGDNLNKGIGVFSYNNYQLKIHPSYEPGFKHIIPISVTGGEADFTLFAIWANNPLDKGFQYVGQVWKALNFYDELLNHPPTVLAGDFNSNTIWDKPRREGNHSTVVSSLEKRNIHSSYHHFFNQRQGKEKKNTLFMYRHPDKSYHIDYCFVSASLLEKMVDVKIGTHKKWSHLSDHTPLIVTFDT